MSRESTQSSQQIITPQFGVHPRKEEKRKGTKKHEPITNGHAVIEEDEPMDVVNKVLVATAQTIMDATLEATSKDVADPEVTEREEVVVTEVDATLVRILRWKRPHDSAAEKHFCTWLQAEIQERGGTVHIATGGNIISVVPYPKDKFPEGTTVLASANLFSCHVDTVHHECSGEQEIVFDADLGHIFLDTKAPGAGSCLGADDGAGIWLCLEMIKAKVPGTYIFHRGEERGGIGSRAMLSKEYQFLSRFQTAIAFDRKDGWTGDILTHQGGQECCSDRFADALAKALRYYDDDLRLTKSIQGVFTDTKVYRGVIPECTNISVGYENAHSNQEYLDYIYLLRLKDALINIEWDDLPIERDETKAFEYTREPYTGHGYNGNYNGGSSPNTNGFPKTPAQNFGTTASGGDSSTTGKSKEWAAADAHFDKKVMAKVKAKAEERRRMLMRHARSAGEPSILDELRTLSMDDLVEVAADPDTALSVIVAMFAEMEGMVAKVEMYRSLCDLTG